MLREWIIIFAENVSIAIYGWLYGKWTLFNWRLDVQIVQFAYKDYVRLFLSLFLEKMVMAYATVKQSMQSTVAN